MSELQPQRVRSPPPSYDEIDASYEQVIRDDNAVVPSIANHDSAGPSLSNESTTNRTTLPTYDTSSSQPLVMTWQSNVNPQSDMSVQSPQLEHHVIYVFLPFSSTSMLLISSANSAESRPQYHISYREDYFLPGSFITTIRRGGSEEGQYVGEFDLRAHRHTGTVRMGNQEKWLNEVLKVTSSNETWLWKFHRETLFWGRVRPLIKECRLGNRTGIILAKLATPNYATRQFGANRCKIQINPEGRWLFDEILISGLIIERQRATAMRD